MDSQKRDIGMLNEKVTITHSDTKQKYIQITV